MKTKLFILLLIVSLFSTNAYAKPEVNKSFFSKVAVHGYDVVSYFTEAKPVKGDAKYQTEYESAKWNFSSEKNLELFKKSPAKYAPQYGGYCAYAVSQGSTADIDPNTWTVVNDKLYLNYNKEIQKKWRADQAEFIKTADKNWPSVIK